MERCVTVLVAEPLAVVRAGLRALLEAEADFRVLGEIGSRPDLPDRVRQLRPAVLILEPGLAGNSPGQLLASLRGAHPALRVVILANPRDEAAALALVEAGAVGCFLQSDRSDEFLRGVRAAVAGDLAMSSAIARHLLRRTAGQAAALPVEALTDREREILHLLTAGLANKEIAQKLYLSVRTVEVHLRSIYGKLGVRSRLEAVAQTLRQETN